MFVESRLAITEVRAQRHIVSAPAYLRGYLNLNGLSVEVQRRQGRKNKKICIYKQIFYVGNVKVLFMSDFMRIILLVNSIIYYF